MSKEVTLAQVYECLGLPGTPEKDLTFSGVNTLQDAGPEHISFLDNKLYKKYLNGTQAGVVLIRSEEKEENVSVLQLEVSDPYLAFAKIAYLFEGEPKPTKGIHSTAIVDDSAVVPSSCSIGPNAVIKANVVLGEDVTIGANTVVGEHTTIAAGTKLFDNVTIYYGTIIGKQCRIHSGAVVGSDGFGNARTKEGWLRIPHLGHVVIEDDVDIGSNTTIDRGSTKNTIIAKGVRIDNLVQIAHNVQIGENTAIAGCCGIAGSAKIGRNCLIAGGVKIAGHLTITDGVVLGAMSGVANDVKEPGMYSSGSPIQPHRKWIKNVLRFKQLDDLFRKVVRIERKLEREST